jgi:hypothetical protein
MNFAPTALAVCLALLTLPALADGRDIDKVNGAITAEAGQQYGDLETVNGSIDIGANARVDDAGTVNGGIEAADGAQARSFATVNGSIQAGRQVRVRDDVGTVNGDIFFDRGSHIGGDVETVNGDIGLVDTDLLGGIASVSGDLTVGVGSHVRGGIHYEEKGRQLISFDGKPRVVIGPDARVDGPLVFEREVDLFVHSSAQIGPVTGATAVRYEGARAPQGE